MHSFRPEATSGRFRSIAALCRDLGMHVAAEEIGTTGGRLADVEIGGELLQDYLIGRRLPPS